MEIYKIISDIAVCFKNEEIELLVDKTVWFSMAHASDWKNSGTGSLFFSAIHFKAYKCRSTPFPLAHSLTSEEWTRTAFRKAFNFSSAPLLGLQNTSQGYFASHWQVKHLSDLRVLITVAFYEPAQQLGPNTMVPRVLCGHQKWDRKGNGQDWT